MPPNAALNAAADDIIASDPSLLAMKSSLSQKRAVLLDQLAGLTANHPLRKVTEEQLSEIEDALQQMQAKLRGQAVINLEQKLRTDLIRASTVEAKLLSDLAANTHQATQAAPSFQRAQVLRGEIAALEARYVTLDERTRNLELESKSPGSVHLFSAARVPWAPSRAKLPWLGDSWFLSHCYWQWLRLFLSISSILEFISALISNTFWGFLLSRTSSTIKMSSCSYLMKVPSDSQEESITRLAPQGCARWC